MRHGIGKRQIFPGARRAFRLGRVLERDVVDLVPGMQPAKGFERANLASPGWWDGGSPSDPRIFDTGDGAPAAAHSPVPPAIATAGEIHLAPDCRFSRRQSRSVPSSRPAQMAAQQLVERRGIDQLREQAAAIPDQIENRLARFHQPCAKGVGKPIFGR